MSPMDLHGNLGKSKFGCYLLVHQARRHQRQNLPLAKLTVLAASYQDIDGDQDVFPDRGETGLVTVTLQNSAVSAGPRLCTEENQR